MPSRAPNSGNRYCVNPPQDGSQSCASASFATPASCPLANASSFNAAHDKSARDFDSRPLVTPLSTAGEGRCHTGVFSIYPGRFT